nr:hypothetical protein GZ19A5_26 [uncultured archaeon GZfos19A5]
MDSFSTPQSIDACPYNLYNSFIRLKAFTPWHITSRAYLKFPEGKFGRNAEGMEPDTLCYAK